MNKFSNFLICHFSASNLKELQFILLGTEDFQNITLTTLGKNCFLLPPIHIISSNGLKKQFLFIDSFWKSLESLMNHFYIG